MTTNEIQIAGGAQWTEYVIEVSGSIWPANEFGPEAGDTIENGSIARGVVRYERDTYLYTGTVTRLQFDPDANVFHNGERVPDDQVQERLVGAPSIINHAPSTSTSTSTTTSTTTSSTTDSTRSSRSSPVVDRDGSGSASRSGSIPSVSAGEEMSPEFDMSALAGGKVVLVVILAALALYFGLED